MNQPLQDANLFLKSEGWASFHADRFVNKWCSFSHCVFFKCKALAKFLNVISHMYYETQRSGIGFEPTILCLAIMSAAKNITNKFYLLIICRQVLHIVICKYRVLRNLHLQAPKSSCANLYPKTIADFLNKVLIVTLSYACTYIPISFKV